MEKHRTKIVALFIVVIAAIFLSLPFYEPKFIPTHDGEYHIIRYMDFFRVLADGTIIPRFAPTMNSGYGTPIFNFQYPFPNYIGSFLHLLGLQFVDGFKVSIALGYLVAGVGCLWFLSALFGLYAGTIGTLAMLMVPYWFVDMGVRGSVGEVWALAWVFVAMGSLVRKKSTLLGISIFLLIISHNILSMLFVPLIGIAVAFIDINMIISWVLGIAAASYFFIPALFERGYVVGLNTTSYADNFASLKELIVPSWGTGFSTGSPIGKMSFQIGVASFIWIGFAIWKIRSDSRKIVRTIGLTLIGGMIAVVFLMMPASTFIWANISILQFVQYPWRLLSFFIPIVGLVASYAASREKKIWVALGILILSAVTCYRYSRPVQYERRDDAYYQSRQNFTDGTSSMGNAFSTIWAPWEHTRAVSPLIAEDATTKIQGINRRPTSLSLHIDTPKPNTLTASISYYPGWVATIEGKQTPIIYNDGLIHVHIPKGSHKVKVTFTETPLRTFADLLSLCSLTTLFILGYTRYRTTKAIIYK